MLLTTIGDRNQRLCTELLSVVRYRLQFLEDNFVHHQLLQFQNTINGKTQLLVCFFLLLKIVLDC